MGIGRPVRPYLDPPVEPVTDTVHNSANIATISAICRRRRNAANKDCTEHATDELVGLWRFRRDLRSRTGRRERLWAASSV